MKALSKGQMRALLEAGERDLMDPELIGTHRPQLEVAVRKLRENIGLKTEIIDICGYCGKLAHEGKCVQKED